MGYAEKTNPDSKWNKEQTEKKIEKMQVSTPVRDEPLVIELTFKGVYTFFKGIKCRVQKRHQSKQLSQPKSPAPTS